MYRTFAQTEIMIISIENIFLLKEDIISRNKYLMWHHVNMIRELDWGKQVLLK